jgi:acyl-CoA dehydrogenase
MTSEVREAVDAMLAGADAAAVQRLLVDGGWSVVGVAEENGGGGGSIVDAADVAAGIAASGAGSWIGDSAIVSGWLLAQVSLRIPTETLPVIVVSDSRGELGSRGFSASASRVAFARSASHFAVVVPADDARTRIALVPASGSVLTHGQNLAGEPRDTVVLDGVPADATAIIDRPWHDVDRDLERLGALLRSVQIAAGIERVLDLSARYATERVQFGSPISRLQAVQYMLAELVGERAAALAVSSLAVRVVAEQGPGSESAGVAVAAAKVRTDQAASLAARIAHQVHGAIGVTREHPLHLSTQALLSWRDEHGDGTTWSHRLATLVEQHADELWSWLTALDETRPAGVS